MGYDVAMALASMILLVPILAVAAIIHFGLRKLRFVPPGRAGLPAYALIVLGAYALIFLGTAAQLLWLKPAHLQAKYIGRAYGTPLTLRSFEISGFQDPADKWRYRLDDAALTELKKRCTPESPFADSPARCSLYSNQDERWFAGVWIEGQELHMIDGLH